MTTVFSTQKHSIDEANLSPASLLVHKVDRNYSPQWGPENTGVNQKAPNPKVPKPFFNFKQSRLESINADPKRRNPVNQRVKKPVQLRENLHLRQFRTMVKRLMEKNQTRRSPEAFCLINVKKTKNNTFCTISHLFGPRNTLWSISGGQIHTGAKANGRRKARITQRLILKNATEKLFGLGFKYLVVHCSGRTLSKRYIFKTFYRRFKLLLLKDCTSIPHNGCRPARARRL